MKTLTFQEKDNLKIITGRIASGKTRFVQEQLKNTGVPAVVVTNSMLQSEWEKEDLQVKRVLPYTRNVESVVSSILTWLRLPHEEWSPNQVVVFDEFIPQHQNSQKLFNFSLYLSEELGVQVYILSQQDISSLFE